MKKGLKQVLSLTLAATMVLSLAGCSGGSSSGSGSTGTTAAGGSGESSAAQAQASSDKKPIVVNVNEAESTLTSLDFYHTTIHSENQYAEMVYDPLIEGDYDGNFSPCLAESWTLSDDGLEAELKLAQGVKFHDGTDFNADDVVATIGWFAKDVNSVPLVSSKWLNLKGVEKVDDYTVKIYFNYPLHTFEQALSTTFVFSNEDWDKYGEDMWNQKVINGTGPYKFVEWVDGQYTEYAINEDYWKGRHSNIDSVKIWYITEANTVVSSLLSGDIDTCAAVNTDLVPMLSGNDDISVDLALIDNLNYIQFRCGPGGAFEDINMRKAVMHGFDCQNILNLYDGGQILGAACTVGDIGCVDDLEHYAYDPELAKQYLEAAGYDGRTITLYSTKAYTNEMTSIAGDLAKIGMNIEIKPVDSAEFASIRSNGEYDMFYGFNAVVYSDLMAVLVDRVERDIHSHGYVDEEMNAWIEEANGISDPEVRAPIMQKVYRKMYELYGPICGTVQKARYSATRKGLEGVTKTKGGKFYFRNMYVDETVWNK